MTDQPPPVRPAAEPARASLHELAQLLRAAHHLDPGAQRDLADLMDEMAEAIGPAAPSAQVDHLAESSAHLVHVLHDRQDAGRLAAAKNRLADAAARAEAKAPVATGVALRLIDTLAGLGI